MTPQCNIFGLGFFTIVLFLSVVSARAISLEELLQKSDAVVYASAFGWSVVDAETVEVALRVEGKPVRGSVGDAVVSARFRSAHADKIGPFRQMPSGLWFLSRDSNDDSGKWTAHQASPSRLPSVSSYVLPVPVSQFERDAVAPSVHVIAERMVAEIPPPQAVASRRLIARGLDSPAIRAAFVRWRDANDETVSAFGAAELLVRGDVATLHEIQRAPERIVGLTGKAQGVIFTEIAQAFRSVDPDGIAALSALALDVNGSTDLRAAAAHALAKIHSPHTLRALAALLNDRDVELREKGCIGLGMFANGMPMHLIEHAKTMDHLKPATISKYQSPEVSEYFGFDRNRETEFVHFWKDWWQKHQDDFP